MAAFAGGKTLGIARKATLIQVQVIFKKEAQWPFERFLEAMVIVANRCKGTKDTTVVNMSWGGGFAAATPKAWNIMRRLSSPL